MAYTITAAQYKSADNLSALLTTVESGAVMASQADRPALWANFLAWVAGGGAPAAYEAPPSLNTMQRNEAIMAITSGISAHDKSLRCALALILDELNDLRKRDRDRAEDVAAAATLAALKTAWAARSTLADRTLAQAKTAFDSKIDGGTLDSGMGS